MNKPITFITGNAAKAEQLKKYLSLPVDHVKIDLTEIQSLNLDEVVEYKVKEAFKHVNKPVLVEDTSLTFNALGKLPGPLIKWFLKELENEGLTNLLNGLEDRSALAEVGFGFYDGNTLKIIKANIAGSISLKPQGDTVFGWDPIFIPEGDNRTWAQIPEEERAKTSIRRKALKELEKFLQDYVK